MITFRSMTLHDLDIMTKWLQKTEVLEFYGDPKNPFTYEQVKEKYSPRINGKTSITPYIIEYNEQSIGYIQCYPYKEKPKEKGIDLFIGEPQFYGTGLGTKTIKAFIQRLVNEDSTEKIFVDPHHSNKRAIRCYEKCGFETIDMINDGESHIMRWQK